MTAGSLRFRGPAAALGPADRRALIDRALPGTGDVRTAVRSVLEAVATRGDQAVAELTARFDGVRLERFEVPRARWRAALERLPAPVRTGLARAARNIETAHRAWVPVGATVETEPGIVLERRPFPLARVGIYAPGGRAVYPSSVLMGVVPARVAGVGEIIVCSPAAADGAPADPILAACELAGADRVFAIGGAQAVAALAFGTEQVPRVDRIVGPGNAYVMEAKLQVSDRVGIDGPAGPSEVLIVADRSTPVEVIVAELIAQAEHDPRAAVVALLVGDGIDAAGVEAALAAAADRADRREIVAEALRGLGAILTVPTLEEAVAFANEFAPEHLLLAFDGAERWADRFSVAGAVFVGASSSVAFGDYLTGGNHVLPTAGLARSYSGLGPADFVRWTNYQRVSAAAAARLAADTAALALAEGLPGHALAARQWEAR